jgi:N-acetylmuramoyl-L-alanine amidase
MNALSPLAAGCAALFAVAVSGADARRTGPARTEAIDMVVIHSTGGPTCDPQTNQPIWVGAGTLAANIRFIEAHPQLGIHYMVDRDGTVRTSVPEAQLAHHVFRYSGRSIGIELINDGNGRDPFPKTQLAALVDLLRDIAGRRGLTRDGIKRHSDLDHSLLSCGTSQRRKVDPGDAFPLRSVLDQVFEPAATGAAATERAGLRRR